MLDGLEGTNATAKLDGNGRTDLIGVVQWRIIALPSGTDITSNTTLGVTLAEAADRYQVTFVRPPAGQYKIRWTIPVNIFADEEFETFAQLIPSVESFVPTVSMVGSILRARTKDVDGNELGTFNDLTRPTDDQVRDIIQQATNDVTAAVDTDVPVEAFAQARSVIALRAALLVELSFFPEQVPTGRSPYAQLLELYEGQDGSAGSLGRLKIAVDRERSEELSGDETTTAGTPWWYGPIDRPIGMRTRW